MYTHWLNERGGIEAELTVTRLAGNEFLVVSGAGSTRRDLAWLERHIDGDAHAVVVDVTAQWAVFGVMGPKSRDVVGAVTGEDLSSGAFPFGAVRDVEIGCATGARGTGLLRRRARLGAVRARRPGPARVRPDHGGGRRRTVSKLAGMHALDSGRIEKKFVHFGHDVADVDTPVEAGMRWVCRMDKAAPFIGRDAIARQLDSNRPPPKRLLQLLLADPEPLLFGHEPMLRDGETVGYLTSGNYGHTLGGGVGLGYAKHDDGVSREWVESGSWEILVEGRAGSREGFAARAVRPEGREGAGMNRISA